MENFNERRQHFNDSLAKRSYLENDTTIVKQTLR